MMKHGDDDDDDTLMPHFGLKVEAPVYLIKQFGARSVEDLRYGAAVKPSIHTSAGHASSILFDLVVIH